MRTHYPYQVFFRYVEHTCKNTYKLVKQVLGITGAIEIGKTGNYLRGPAHGVGSSVGILVTVTISALIGFITASSTVRTLISAGVARLADCTLPSTIDVALSVSAVTEKEKPNEI